MIERTIAAATHGRYLVEPPRGEASGLLIGFHGYAEAAETQLARMQRIAGVERWAVVAIQGLHRFYQRRTNEVIASWMTRQDRDLAIADNLAYVAAVVDAVVDEWPRASRLVFAGFSQGVAMTLRAASHSQRAIAGIIAVGGDVPPELTASALGRVPAALVCHGVRDAWYTPEKFQQDVARLRATGTNVEALEFDGGHEWSDPVARAAGVFLARTLG